MRSRIWCQRSDAFLISLLALKKSGVLNDAYDMISRSPKRRYRRVLVAAAIAIGAQVLAVPSSFAQEDPGQPPKFVGMAAKEFHADFET